MSQRVIALGDIHGCSVALRTLIDTIEPRRDDTLIPLGDCVDRGPDSRGVMDQLLALREQCHLVPLMGNHEEMMLNHLDGRPQPNNWLDVGGLETLMSYSPALEPAAIPAEHVEYMRTWGDYLEAESHFCVHASYEPNRPLFEQHWQTLRWHSLHFGVPGPHISGKTAVVGHTSQKNGEILDLGHLICIDTYCWGGGWLTALEIASGQIWQASRDGQLRP